MMLLYAASRGRHGKLAVTITAAASEKLQQ